MTLIPSLFSPGIKISDTTSAHLLASNSNLPYVKCVDIYPHNENDVLLAIGQINGKVVLNTFGQTVFDCLGLAGKELGKRAFSHPGKFIS